MLATSEAASRWDVLYTQQAGPLAELYDRLRSDPRAIANRARQGPL